MLFFLKQGLPNGAPQTKGPFWENALGWGRGSSAFQKLTSSLGLSHGMRMRDSEYFIKDFGILRTFPAWEQCELLSLTTV